MIRALVDGSHLDRGSSGTPFGPHRACPDVRSGHRNERVDFGVSTMSVGGWQRRSRGGGVLGALFVVMVVLLGACSTESGSGSATAADSAASDKATPKKPAVTHRKKQVRHKIPFATKVIKTSSLDQGVTQIRSEGRPGLKVNVVSLTMRAGHLVKSHVVRSFVLRPPVARVRLVGTKQKPKPASSSCDPNYAGACVPISSDVDLRPDDEHHEVALDLRQPPALLDLGHVSQCRPVRPTRQRAGAARRFPVTP